MRIRNVILGLYLAGILPVSGQQNVEIMRTNKATEQWLDLYVASEKGTNSLLWLPRIWHGDAIAVMPKRWNGSGWESFTAAYVVPEISTNRNWASTGLPEVEQQRLSTLRDEFVDSGEYDEIDIDNLRGLLATAGRQDLGGFRIDMRYDFDRALIQGFACVDTNGVAIEKYAVFAVYEDESISVTPIAIRSVVQQSAFSPVFSTARSRGGVQVQWEADHESVNDVGVFGFHLNRAPLGSAGQGTPFSEELITGYTEEGDKVIWRLHDAAASADDDYKYTIEAVDLFQNSFGEWTVDYVAADNVVQPPPISNLSLLSVTQTNTAAGTAAGDDIYLEWNATTNASASELSFRVLRMDESTGAQSVVGENLAASTRSFLDESVSWGGRYRYRVEAIHNGSVIAQSNISFARVHDLRELNAPEEFTAMAVSSNDVWTVQLSWALVDDAVGYAIYTDRAGFGKQRLAIPLVENNEYEVRLGRRPHGGEFSFWVAPVNARRVVGNKAQITIDLMNNAW